MLKKQKLAARKRRSNKDTAPSESAPSTSSDPLSDPLNNPLSKPLNDSNQLDKDQGEDEIETFFDPLSNRGSLGNRNSRQNIFENPQIVAKRKADEAKYMNWTAKRNAILKKYTTNKKLPVVSVSN